MVRMKNEILMKESVSNNIRSTNESKGEPKKKPLPKPNPTPNRRVLNDSLVENNKAKNKK